MIDNNKCYEHQNENKVSVNNMRDTKRELFVNRVILIVADSLGVGALPDAVKYGDEGADTLGHIIREVPDIKIPNLTRLGLIDINGLENGGVSRLPDTGSCICPRRSLIGRLAEKSKGKDTITGHWEIAGLYTEVPFNTYPEGFPHDFIKCFEKAIGTEVIGNYPASGTEIIEQLGDEHEATGKPIVYTSADSVFQIAVNTDVVPLARLYEICETAREMLIGDIACGRVIARPYIKKDGKRVRTSDRKDYALSPPAETMLDIISDAGMTVYAVGKINDIFNGQGITKSVHTENNDDGIEKTIEAIRQDTSGLIFTNLVDFDSKYGHRRDAKGYARAIEEFDAKIPEIISAMKDNDVLMICADHGNDPVHSGWDHTREYIPLIVYSKRMEDGSFGAGVDLGIRSSFADIGATICEMLGTEKYPPNGRSFGNVFLPVSVNEYMNMNDIIAKKRDGMRLAKKEIEFFINGYTAGDIPDYQVSALLMAIYLNGLDDDEIFELTDAMKNSGDIVNLSGIKGIKTDKHSTGGVGDKTTLIIAPIVASCGVPIAKMSGRGLGFTGGTVDKMESVPGMRTSLSSEEFINQVNDIGMAVIGQTAQVAPADKKLYALRDVTATVGSIGLIASSIMSKKLASGSDAIVLDVKCGDGAFMKTKEEAAELGQMMVSIGRKFGKKMVAVISDMSQPLGRAVGNSLEVSEAIETLKGNGPSDLTELSLTLAGIMIYLGEKAERLEAGRNMAENAIKNGSALTKFAEFIAAQGGNPEVINDTGIFKTAEYRIDIASETNGYIENLPAQRIGLASQHAGAGRLRKEDDIDMAAGVYLYKKTGDFVKKGDVLASVFSNSKIKAEEAAAEISEAYFGSSLINVPDDIDKAEITERLRQNKSAIIKEIIGL